MAYNSIINKLGDIFMDKQQNECTCRISKAGPNLFAKIPYDELGISRGDLVKVILLEKALPPNKEELKKVISEFVKNPRGNLKGKIMGYPIDIPFAKIINALTLKKAEKIIYEVMLR